MIDALRTPDGLFDGLPDFEFEPHYLDGLPGFSGLRLHHLDEGPRDAEHLFLCLHGEPSWCYLYRKMIPVFVAAGHRAVAPDFFGFGRSDKPVDDAVYTFDFHRRTLLRFVEALDLRRITLVCQDWGGILGLTLPMEMPGRFERLIVMNTAIATGQSPGQGFLDWKAFVASQPDLDVAALMKRAVPGISDEEAAAYGAPFPDRSYKAGVRRFPELVPIEPSMPGAEIGRRAAAFWKSEWRGPSFMAIGLQDPVLGKSTMLRLREVLRGCPEPLELPEAGHFVQEHGEEVAREALRVFDG